MKNLLKILALVLVFAMTAVMFVACGNNDDNPDDGGDTPQTPVVTVDTTVSGAALKNIVGSGRLIVTAAGQSSTVSVESLLENAGWTMGTESGAKVYVINNKLTAADLQAGDTVIIVLGTSGKGLGDAGVSQEDELRRAEAIVEKDGINIIALHTGKKEYRGNSSDPIIEAVVPAAKVALVVDDGKGSGGNYDGLFTRLCGSSVPLYTFSKVSKMVESVSFLVNA